MIRLLAAAAALASFTLPALADSCRRTGNPGPYPRTSSDCPQTERVQPYDPDRVRSGNRPGVIDLGNGSEVRVGGRVQVDYDARRR